MLNRKMMFALCLTILTIAAAANAMQYVKVTQHEVRGDETLIDRLKTTSMNKMDAALPAETFEAWFARQRKDSAIRYEIETCDDTDSRTPYAGKGLLKCVTAVSVQGSSELVLRFVAALPDKDGKPQPVDCRFLSGSEGPSPGSHIKRMTRLIFKLSDLHWD